MVESLVEVTQETIIIVFGIFVSILILVVIIMLFFMGRNRSPKRVVKKKERAIIKEQTQLAGKPSFVEETQRDPVEYEGGKPFNPLKYKKSKLSFKYWKDWYMERRHPETTVLVNIELVNGFHKMFLVKERDEGFKYRGKKYLFDNEFKYYIIDTKLYAFDYHEDLVLPVRRRIPVSTIRKTMDAVDAEIAYATNPRTLEQFVISKIAEGIMKGSQLDEVFKFLKFMLLIILVVVVIHLLLFASKSGILSSVNVPGVTA